MDQSAAVDVTDAVRRIEAAAASIPIHVARRPGPAAAEVLARAYEKATAGTSTWYRTGKRALHQPQLERFVATRPSAPRQSAVRVERSSADRLQGCVGALLTCPHRGAPAGDLWGAPGGGGVSGRDR